LRLSTRPQSHATSTFPFLSLLALALTALIAGPVLADRLIPGNLVVSRSVYTGVASTVTVGQPLPGGGIAVANGSYPGVWANESVDASFGVASPIFLDQITPSGALVSSLNVTSALANIFATSFPSKSELSLNLSPDGTVVTFMAYQSAPNALDVSNSNTPGHIDPTNPVGTYPVNQSPSARAVIELDLNGNLEATSVNSYSGNNGRGAILGGTGYYYMVGNAGNGGNITIKGVNTIAGNSTLTITGAGNSAALMETGQPISGGSIPAGATVVSITDPTHFVISAAPSATSPASFSATITQTGTVLSALSDNTGVQMVDPDVGGETTVVGMVNGTFGSATGYQRGFSIGQINPLTGQPYGTSDKTGKDDNFRGLTIFDDTLYVTKGSGSNGIDTVYQVGAVGSLPTPANAGTTSITVLPGFPTALARSLTGVDSTTTTDGQYNANFSGTATEFYPFGIWFANATTLYVADEGAPITTVGAKAVSPSLAALDPHAGLQKWSLVNGVWQLDYTLQAGLDLGVPYSVANGPNGEVFPPSMNPATAGLRNLTGRVNGDGTVTLYAVTSTSSTATDQGADPNKLVAITDVLPFTTSADAANEQFVTLQTAGYGEVLRGVTLAGPFALSRSALLYSTSSGGHVQKVIVRNTSSTLMPGPIVVALDDLSPGVTLTNANGTTSATLPLGSPYVIIPGTAAGLAPGTTAVAGLLFRDAPGTVLTYQPRVLSGTQTP
jgi:hypothetical protein